VSELTHDLLERVRRSVWRTLAVERAIASSLPDAFSGEYDATSHPTSPPLVDDTERLMDYLRAVAVARQVHATAASMRKTLYEQHIEPLDDLVKTRAGEADDAERYARYVALTIYTDTGERKPAAGVEVKQFDVVQYDAEAAEAWARENLPAAMTLDKKKFEAAVKAGLVLLRLPAWRRNRARSLRVTWACI
jgi:hypothetical protein